MNKMIVIIHGQEFLVEEMVYNEIMRLRDEVSRMSWENNPDRSGGQFTNEEILDRVNNNW